MLSEFVQSSRLARLSIPLKKEIQLLIFPIHWDIISWIQPWGMIIYNLGNKMKGNLQSPPLPGNRRVERHILVYGPSNSSMN